MQITTRARYATRAVLEIAQRSDSEPVPAKTIARNQEIPAKYLETLFKHLRIAGLVKSTRGANGGYMLAVPSEEITLLDIVDAVEEKLAVTECVSDPKACHRSPMCATRDIWDQLDQTVRRMLASVSLSTLVEKHNEKQLQAISYCI